MGIKEDFDKLIAVWKELSFIWKVVLGTMLAGQLMSIASIGESVYKFKGFILHGIEYYRSTTEPLISLLTSLGIPHFDRDTLDASVWLLLFIGAGLRTSNIIKDKYYTVAVAGGAIIFLVIVFFMYNPATESLFEVMFSGVLGMIIYGTISRKTWLPALLFLFPIVLLSIIASVSHGLSNA